MQNAPSIFAFIPFVIFPIIWLFMMIVGFGGMILWIFMLVHVAQHDVKDKTAWILVVALTGFIGAIVYYFAVKRPYDAQRALAATAPVPPIAPQNK